MSYLVWITGLAGSGKTTIAKRVYEQVKKKQTNVFFLDGDIFREILGGSSGYTREDRFDVAMQISRMCKCLVEQNINVICSTISLFKEVHEFNRKNIKNYYEILIDCDMKELIKRDKNGIYSRALKGELNNVVGVDISFHKPTNCDLIVDNTVLNKLEEKSEQIVALIK